MNWRLQRRGAGLAWRRAGDRRGPPVVLLHGFFQDSRAWAATLRRLPTDEVRRYHWIAPDLPGHGASRALQLAALGGGAWPALALLLDDVVDAALGDDRRPVSVAGYSFGGRAAAWWLQHSATLAGRAAPGARGLAGRGVAAALLESAHPGLAPDLAAQRRRDDEARAAALTRQGTAAFAEAWAALPLFASQRDLPPAVQRAQRRLRLAQSPWGLADHLLSLGTGTMPRLDGPPPAWPTTLLVGALDPAYAALAERWQRAWPQARLEVAAGAGHNVHLERPALWWRTLVALCPPAGDGSSVPPALCPAP